MCLMTSLAKQVITVEVRGKGLLSLMLIVVLFGTGTMVELKHLGTLNVGRDRLKVFAEYLCQLIRKISEGPQWNTVDPVWIVWPRGTWPQGLG